MNNYIPYGRQDIDQCDIEFVIETLNSDWLTQGPRISQFESAIANYCVVKHAIAVSNGTAALHLICMALGIGAGDLVWTTPNTFVASANCARFCGADVDFVDIDPKTYNLSVDALERKLKFSAETGKLPKLVIPVHFAGQSCDMEAIYSLSKKYHFHIVEDACHAIGGNYKNYKIGSCQFSDATVFSFHPVKLITTGEGGMVVTNNDELNLKLRTLLTHGITREPTLMNEEPHGPWYYQQITLGYNYRITDIQSALGISQLRKLNGYVNRRHELAKYYDSKLQELPLVIPYQANYNYSAYHLYVIRLKLNTINKTRLSVFNELREAGIGVNVHYIPVHLQPYYRQLGFKKGDFPEAEKYYEEAITLPLFPTLTEKQQDYIINQLNKILL
ncbi:TPA: UDP-4-amino-4,6-dideoxy-N-acetyl-beta-L-altrosamine transaminase [Legionella pneumophila]|uniref:Putative 3-amino-5-hydroxybenzoic acid synthase (AHBA synthase) n=1 Tax=Legionella pneumophila TaxID=446 RepID=E7BBG4_LEGPN|nr:UDP-4-amino-4,6-dideoxy-N-acetyl-beta-L-altrosamine transaminase [Legionella pneumophila]HAT8912848.1 UDP-4-amino-4,6-dideoxy-N-acetyl-beta-L-altrosamine transaminase [Legionella pneumophila subsp. pneumophila]MCK0183383.1 UDP-4-amino-4,6-dideoxy-N-acetyl-beta-L-altrosamine transaminase [Legionella pneumophila]MCK1880932.1 UDP-4-amino-4,6-dideoxy-N-acetyl-beta-L-altrosamine transaminase [Legionella pneumophila]MCK1890329.1 UDP-4-amino-4,6-dideoxy-N-acetyl-beta-L-altrosamine transaminase [Leg